MHFRNFSFEALKKNRKPALAMLLAWTLTILPAPLSAQSNVEIGKTQDAKKSSPAKVAQSSQNTELSQNETQAEETDTQKGGIKVHGHWKIVVKNADGTVASINEFENSLAIGSFSGDLFLANVLGRKSTTGQWGVKLTITGGTSGNIITLLENSGNLTMTANTTNTTSATIVLSGTGKSTSDGNLTEVDSILGNCRPDVTMATCAAAGAELLLFPFTTRVLTTAIPVKAQQSIDVKITISFS